MAESGEIVNISVADTLISDKFPFRLWAMQSITNRGGVVTMRNEHMSISLPGIDSIVLASKSSSSRLFIVKILREKKKVKYNSNGQHWPIHAMSFFLFTQRMLLKCRMNAYWLTTTTIVIPTLNHLATIKIIYAWRSPIQIFLPNRLIFCGSCT